MSVVISQKLFLNDDDGNKVGDKLISCMLRVVSWNKCLLILVEGFGGRSAPKKKKQR